MEASIETFKYSGETAPADLAWRVAIAPGPSRRVAAWITGVAAAALAAILAAAVPPVAKAVLAAILACAAVRAARRDAWQEGAGAVRRFRADLPGRVEVEFFDGRLVAGRLEVGSFVAPWLTLVRWRPDGARLCRTLLVAPDAVDAGEFRRLRVLLRWR
jgi:toxin CptA